MMKLGA